MTTRVLKRRKHTTAVRLDAVTTFDPVTGQLRHGRVERRPFQVVLHLPKRLESANRWLWTHWRVKHRVALAWGQVIRLAVLDTALVDRATAVRVSPAAAIGWLAPPMKVRVEVERLVRTRQGLITDNPNLVIASKAVVDQVVKAGFLVDDSDEHIDLVPTQRVSPDRLDWTVITITAPRPEGPAV